MKRTTSVLSLLAVGLLACFAAAGASSATPQAKPTDSPSPSPSASSTNPANPPEISPQTHDFGTVCVGTSSDPFPFSVANPDPEPMTITGIVAPLPFVASSPANPVVVSGASTIFTVRYRPDGAGSDSSSVVVQTDHGSATATLSGNGLDKQLSVAPTSLSFGPQRTGKAASPRTVTIANTGSQPLSISKIALGGAGAKDYSLTGGGAFTLAGNSSHKLTIGFKPSSDGIKPATLTIVSDACVGAIRTIKLSGAGARPKIGVRPTTLELSGFTGKEGPPETVTVSDAGDAPLVIKGIKLTGVSVKQFLMSGLPRFPATVVPGDSFVFDVRFRPSSIVDPPPVATLEISSTDPKTPVVKLPVKTLYASPSPSPSATLSAAPAPSPPPKKSGGSRFHLGVWRDYFTVLGVALLVAAVFASLVVLRKLKMQRVIRRWSSSA